MPLPAASNLQGRRILLGVTGSIAAYKALELLRLLRKDGAQVRVLMSRMAENFVGALSFQSLSGNEVLRSLEGGASGLSATAHIDLAQWGEALVIAPATANFISKYALGVCDDALLTESLAFQGPVLVAPAMNPRMWEAAPIREHRDTLSARGVRWVGPAHGELACGETGEGKMSEAADIFAAVQTLLADDSKVLSGCRVLVSSGPTRAYLDDVRYLSNRSSGRMGHALALAAERLGAEVTLVTGPVEPRFACLPRGRVLKVETNEEMFAAAREALPRSDIFFSAAAVGDFQSEQRFSGKVPREGTWKLELSAARDVLASLAELKGPRQLFVGFAAEIFEAGRITPALHAKLKGKVERKRLDLLAVNDVGRADIGFDASDNEIHLFDGALREELLPKASKESIAEQLLRAAHARWKAACV